MGLNLVTSLCSFSRVDVNPGKFKTWNLVK